MLLVATSSEVCKGPPLVSPEDTLPDCCEDATGLVLLSSVEEVAVGKVKAEEEPRKELLSCIDGDPEL